MEIIMRKIIDFNNDWYFSKDNSSGEIVTLPHTWNSIDGMDGKNGYARGTYYYTKTFSSPKLQPGEKAILEIPAAALSARVFLNGEEIGSHEGGFSSFSVDLTKQLFRPSENTARNRLTIAVSNENQSNIYPQMADFTFYGGLYRGARLLILPPVHFATGSFGESSLRVRTSLPAEKLAKLSLHSQITPASADYTIRYCIVDQSGLCVAESWRPADNPDTEILLPEPVLWQGVENPYLYHCRAALVYRNEVVDEISTTFGIRSFSVDSRLGFCLNGKPVMLRGVSRHQDFLWQGNALSREQHYADAALIAELGANTVRLAHYQHSEDFYNACDEYGFIVWAEIPYISRQSDDPKAHENAMQQMQELILQNINHPSICFWGLSNEITIGGSKPNLVENHQALNSLVKKLDPDRLTTMAHVSMLPMDSPLHGITDVEAYNHYFGWYGGSMENNEKWLDTFHEKYPAICLGLSEYGAEGILTYQSASPRCRDYSEGYQTAYHEHMAEILMERPYLWATYVWNLFDFGCAARNEGGTAGRNNKGLVTMDRRIKKDAFFLYKAYWSRIPFVHLAGRRYAKRAGEAVTIRVYSNQPCVSLFLDGAPVAILHDGPVFCFENIPLTEGLHSFTARTPDNCLDTITLERVSEEPEIYTLPREEDDREGVTNWFEKEADREGVTEIPLAFSPEHYSVCDTINDLSENEEAFQILSDALFSMTGMRLKKSMLAMMGESTFLELSATFQGFGDSSSPSIPENAMQLINAALSRVKKKTGQLSHGQKEEKPPVH